MKKPLIDVRKINNNDVIATSGCSVSDFGKYNYLYQSNGFSNYSSGESIWNLQTLNGTFYIYSNSKWNETTSNSFQCYYGLSSDTPTVTNGKWYHVYYGEEPNPGTGEIIECTDPNHHGAGAN